MDRLYFLEHAPIPFHFRQNSRDFVVEEIGLYDFSGEGEHLVLHVRKKELATWDMIDIFARHLGIKPKEIGYAGLKDKHALTKQYISLHRSHEAALERFEHPNIKILSKTYHNNKIRTGHLKGNRFFIRLKKVSPVDAKRIDEAVSQIEKQGMPNFFGYQRFGNDAMNYKRGEEIVLQKRKEKNRRLRKMFVSAYQSHLFNLWLSRRIEISKLVNGFTSDELVPLLNLPKSVIESLKRQSHPFKLLEGDVMMHYPFGKIFLLESSEEIARFTKRDIAPTGALSGKRVKHALSYARAVEKEFLADIRDDDGTRRYAWVFPSEIEREYKEEKAWYELHFTLPKGSYATVLIEEIAKRDIRPSISHKEE